MNFIIVVVKSAICSHGRSHELLTDSIHSEISNACHFEGRKWNQEYENISALVSEGCAEDVCPEMGVNSIKYHPDKDGTYFVPTADDAHYCREYEIFFMENVLFMQYDHLKSFKIVH